MTHDAPTNKAAAISSLGTGRGIVAPGECAVSEGATQQPVAAGASPVAGDGVSLEIAVVGTGRTRVMGGRGLRSPPAGSELESSTHNTNAVPQGCRCCLAAPCSSSVLMRSNDAAINEMKLSVNLPGGIRLLVQTL